MDSGEVAAVAGAVGAALILLGRGRVLLLVGLGLLAVAELGLVHDLSGNRVSTKIAALGALGLIPIAIGAWVFVRWPVLVTPLVAIAAPFRPPLSFGSEHRYFVGVARSGQLGRRPGSRSGSRPCSPSWGSSRRPRTSSGSSRRRSRSATRTARSSA